MATMTSGCAMSSSGPHDLVGSQLDLPDGRTVTCVQNARGNVLSCDWDHAVNKKMEESGSKMADVSKCLGDSQNIITAGPHVKSKECKELQ